MLLFEEETLKEACPTDYKATSMKNVSYGLMFIQNSKNA